MKLKYFDLIDQTFEWPQQEFSLDDDGQLSFHGIPMMDLVEKYGTPLRLTSRKSVRTSGLRTAGSGMRWRSSDIPAPTITAT